MKLKTKEMLRKYVKENDVMGRKVIYIESPVRTEILGTILTSNPMELNSILWLLDTDLEKEAEKDGYEIPDYEYEHYYNYVHILDINELFD